MVHVLSESGPPRGKDYCVLYNPQWAPLPQDLGKAVSALPGCPAAPPGAVCLAPGSPSCPVCRKA